jgi:hypothetical protein
MLLNKRYWAGITIHFTSGKVLSIVGNKDKKRKDVYWLPGGQFISINFDRVDYAEIDTFAGATSLDDPIVKEWEKEHAYKEKE